MSSDLPVETNDDFSEAVDELRRSFKEDYWGPTYEQPLRGRPVDEIEILLRNDLDGICNLCDHLLVRRGSEWGCSEHPCKIAHPMMGCVPKQKGKDD